MMRLIGFCVAVFLALAVIACQTGKNHISSSNNGNTDTDYTNNNADSNDGSQDNNNSDGNDNITNDEDTDGDGEDSSVVVPCGNGIIDAGEDCDGSNLNGQDCDSVGPYAGGDLACAENCTFNVSACTSQRNWLQLNDKVAFLVSDEDWRLALTLIPALNWTANPVDFARCAHPYGGADNVCSYPTLIYHVEADGIDLDSIDHFLSRYQPTTIYHLGTAPSTLIDLVSYRFTMASLASPLSMWHEYDQAILVEDDYALALQATTLASLLDAPLFIAGYNDDLINDSAQVICVGVLAAPVAAHCAETLTSLDVSLRALALTGSDRLLLTNARDTVPLSTSSVALERTSGQIHELYGRLSLASPILAAAKHQVLAVFNDASATYQTVDAFIATFLAATSMQPQYLTIVASPNTIPQARNTNEYLRKPETAFVKWVQIDGSIYGDLDGDYFQDLKVGRLYSLSLSDVTSYIARVLTYDHLPKATDFASLTSFELQFCSGYHKNLFIEELMEAAGFTNASATVGYGQSFAVDTLRDKALLAYDGHGTTTSMNGGFSVSRLRSNAIWFPETVITSTACLICSWNKANKAQLFCAEAFRRGAIAIVSAMDENATNAGVNVSFIRSLTYGADLGSAFRDATNISFADSVQVYSPFLSMLGDPTFNPKWSSSDTVDIVQVETSDLEPQGGGEWLLNVEVSAKPTITHGIWNVRHSSSSRLDVNAPPYYGGASTLISNACYFLRFPDSSSSDPSIENYRDMFTVLAHFSNPEGRILKRVQSASRTIGAVVTDITADLPVDPDFPDRVFSISNAAGTTFIFIKLFIADNTAVLRDTTSVPAVDFHVEFIFE
ncbi:MAG: hypothetical protein JW841_11910 [Deltaproteobacteria bacterium]|nr:hypothetical protein [Deltaproteobacteria bacterium]